MNDYKDLGKKVRQCYKCGKNIYWANFMVGSHNKVQREHFAHDMLHEIWSNPIFIIPCCECFYGNNFVIHEIERIYNMIKMRKKNVEREKIVLC